MPRILRFTLLATLLSATGAHAAIEFDSPIPYSTDGGVYDVALADVDLDGDLDAVVSNYDAHAVSVHLNIGGGAFDAGTSYPAGWSLFTLVRDLDADGLPDLAIANFVENTVTTRRNLGGGVFGPAVTNNVGNGPRCIVATDWNGDGSLDLVVANALDNMVQVLTRTGPGLAYSVIQSAPVGNLPKWMTVGNLDGDARDDIVVANASSGTISVLESNWPGAPTRTDFGMTANPSMVVLADFNGDAITDVATSNENSNAAVRLGNGAGSLGPLSSYFVASSLSQGIVAADFDLDGDIDLVVSNYFSSDVSVLTNTGTGSFLGGIQYPCGSSPRGLSTGDLDGDGDWDLAVTNYVPPNGGGFSVLRNTQAGSENRPEITSLEPAAGAPGMPVTIRGLRFTGAADVRFGTMSSLFTVISDTEIHTIVPPDARTGRVRVTTPEGSDLSPYEFIVRPVILSFVPKTASIGSFVFVNGYNFTGTTGAEVNGVVATFTVLSDMQVRLIVPAGATTGLITVLNPGGSDVSDTILTVVSPPTSGINLSWNDCGLAGMESKTFACNTNSASPFDLFGSFIPPPGIGQFLGMSARLTVQSSTASLPDWWRHGTGECRGTTGLSSNFDFTAGPHSCADFYVGSAVGAHLYQTGYGGPDRAQLLIQAAVPFDNRGPLSSLDEYYAFKVRILPTKTVGGGACSGCVVPVSIRLDEIQLFQPPEVGFDPVITTTASRTTVHWEGSTPNPDGPDIVSFAPTSGPSSTPVTLTGLRFTGTTSVRFGPLEAPYIVDSDTQISTVAPPGVTTGLISVTTPFGSASSDQPFVVPGESGIESINLSWNDCGEAGQLDETFACNTNAGAPFVLMASFTPPPGVNQLLGIEGIVDLRSLVSGVIPDWWRHGAGECRGTTGFGVTSDFTAGPFTCADYWAGQAVGGFLYQPSYDGPDHARLTYQAAIALGNEGPVTPNLEYYAFKVNLLRSKTVGSGSCAGCAEPMCIELTSIQLFQPDAAGFNPVITIPRDHSFVRWQGGGSGCPHMTPVLASLVSAEVEPGRVHLEWLTEEITSARLERRRGTGTWASIAELRAGGDHKLRYDDVDVAPGTSYGYRLATMAGDREILLGETSVTIPVEQKRLALSRTSGSSDPRTVSVSLTLARATPAQLELFDVGGRHLASRSLAGLGPGEHEVQLKADRPLGAGVFFMRLSQDGEKVTRRFAMTR